MEISQTINLYITYVEKEGPFLKVWGQTEKNNSIYVEQFLLGASPQFDLGVGKILIDNLQVGTLVCAKYKDNKYYRARITNSSFLGEGFVEVSFLDYGNRDVVPCSNIRSLQNFPSSFISIPPLATGFIFAEAHCPGGGEWNDTIFENISKEIKYREVQCTLVIQATQYFLVKLYIGGSDLCSLLINRGLMQPISLQAQQAVLLSMSMQRSNIAQAQAAPPASTGINTYKACTLEHGCQYPVYVSYVNDGPCHFSVQLKQSEEVLVMLMNDINSITLRLLEDVPIPGTICLARCQEDGNICRAVVTNEVDNQFKVFYVDFGNYEVVPLDSLYQIPFKYVIPKVMAIRFSLAGVEKSTVTIEMQCAFKQFVDNRLLYMKVLPTPTRMAIPKCELFDPETKTSALDVVNRAAQNAYPEPVSLNRGFSQLVKVSYVYSCNRFYVQLAAKENDLLKLMLDLQASCQTNDPMDPSNVKVGLPCCALFESDQQWYRSQIVEVIGNSVKVRYIDYGNEEAVPISQLKIIDGEQLTVLRPQAIECCLNGYQNMEEDLQRDGFLEELILEGQFTMKVVEMTNKKALVELYDDSNYNIASLLLDKLASAKSQVSPMLVQAGNKIEHRKSFSNQNSPREQNFRQDRKPGRTNDRNENSWRQEKKDFRGNDRNFNENSNEKNSWRQTNKGFSPNSEKFNNRDKNRNRNEWHNKENVGTDEWNNKENESTNSWGTPNSKPQESDDWSTPANSSSFRNNSRENDFRNKGSRFNKDNWNSEEQKSEGFKKRNDFRKDGSDHSSNGSEKGFQKGPRTSSRNDRPQFHKKFDKPRNTSFNNAEADNSWSVSAVSSVIDAAPASATFIPYEVVGTVTDVIISWFHNPCHFYCQLANMQDQFKNLMAEIQQFYKGRKPESAVVGAPIIGLFPEDNVLYRAQILEVLGNQYKVYYVDFGNVSNISKIWSIDKKFMNLPAQAIVCSLNEIAPPGDQWPDPDQYSKYFDKDRYTCSFVNKDEEKTYADFFYGNDDIKQLLIQDGLAVSTQKIIPDIEIPLLLGQQFRAIVKSINNLSDIIIALECEVAVSCKMHNLEEADTKDENSLKRFLERTVIVYVDNVIDDRLEVTLYDMEGTKIEVVSPDEGACDMVELPCPILILRSNLTGYVSYADETSVFIQPTEYAETVACLLDQMYESYENTTQDVTIIPEVELLYAAKSEDGNWYRARVTNISDTQASVSYIDYGNSEDIDFDKLRQLSDKFLETCILCVQVFVTVATDALVDQDVIANIYYGETGWEGTVDIQTPVESSATESAAAAEVKGEQVNIVSNEPVEAPQHISLPSENQQEASVPETAIEPTIEDVQNGIQVVVSHVDSPNEFYLQLADSLTAIEEVQFNLQQEAVAMPVLETPTAGVLCAAPFSLDQQWYRAEVLDADDDITTVRFIDYGNTDVINNETTKIKTLPPNLLSLAVYATRSSLKVKSVDVEWSSTAIERFEALLGDNITAEFIDQDEKTNYVELYASGQNVKDVLISENLALPAELSEENKSTCFVSHLNSPSEFWLQLENCVDELEWIAEQLSGAENFPELDDTTPGTLCAALFPDDQMWYRARILSNTVAGLELLFIDYGNSSISTSLRQLPEDLVVTQPLAQKCSLQKPDGIPYWSPQAVNKFSDISADGQTIFTVHKITTGETSVVQLSIDGQDVTSMLLPETEEGYVKNVEGLDNIIIEKNGEELPENYKLEPLPGMTWTEESTDKFKELNDQGTKLFQIEFIGENTVRLYVDNNDIRTNLGGIKTSVLNVSKTSTDEDKSDDGYLNDTVPINANATEAVDIVAEKENTTIEEKDLNTIYDEATEAPYPQSSSEDIKHILGIIPTEEVTLEEDREEKNSEFENVIESDTITLEVDIEQQRTKSCNSEIVPEVDNSEENLESTKPVIVSDSEVGSQGIELCNSQEDVLENSNNETENDERNNITMQKKADEKNIEHRSETESDIISPESDIQLDKTEACRSEQLIENSKNKAAASQEDNKKYLEFENIIESDTITLEADLEQQKTKSCSSEIVPSVDNSEANLECTKSVIVSDSEVGSQGIELCNLQEDVLENSNNETENDERNNITMQKKADEKNIEHRSETESDIISPGSDIQLDKTKACRSEQLEPSEDRTHILNIENSKNKAATSQEDNKEYLEFENIIESDTITLEADLEQQKTKSCSSEIVPSVDNSEENLKCTKSVIISGSEVGSQGIELCNLQEDVLENSNNETENDESNNITMQKKADEKNIEHRSETESDIISPGSNIQLDKTEACRSEQLIENSKNKAAASQEDNKEYLEFENIIESDTITLEADLEQQKTKSCSSEIIPSVDNSEENLKCTKSVIVSDSEVGSQGVELCNLQEDVLENSKHETENDESNNITMQKEADEKNIEHQSEIETDIISPRSDIQLDKTEACISEQLEPSEDCTHMLNIENSKNKAAASQGDAKEKYLEFENLIESDTITLETDIEQQKTKSSSSEIVSPDNSKITLCEGNDKTTSDFIETNTTSEETKQDSCQKLTSAQGSPKNSEGNTPLENSSECEVAAILKDALENALSKKDEKDKSRPVSRCSGKISHDDRILPATISRPHTPIQDEEKPEERTKSRPASVCSGKISHDERIVPAVLSRPQSPLLSSDDSQEEKNDK